MRSVLTRAATAALLLIPGAAAVGCGSDEPSSPGSSTAQTTSGQSSTSATAQAGGGDCPASPSATVESTNGGYPDDLNWSTVYSVAKRQIAGLGGDGRSIVVFISTTNRPVSELSSRKLELAPGEAALRLKFTNGSQNAESGDYTASPRAKDPNNVKLAIKVTDRTTVQLSNPKGTARLVVDGNRVCGTFSIADKWTTASGDFVADLST
ncbi:hypothetical protein [Mycobacterium sp.]|uniref:hypothetical protein n=1 Tax=Mycobacterium sp. TaxID=1785 RepID=UPI003A8B01E5